MVTVKCVLNNHNECTVFPVVLFINKSLNEMSEVLYEWPFKAVIKSLLSLVPIITFVLHHCYHELSNALPPLFMRPPRLSGHRWSCLLGPGRDCFGGALLVSKKTKTNITYWICNKDKTDGDWHSHEAAVHLQSWRKAPGWWRGGCSCRTLGSTPPYRPETPRGPSTLQHRAWIKQNAPRIM